MKLLHNVNCAAASRSGHRPRVLPGILAVLTASALVTGCALSRRPPAADPSSTTSSYEVYKKSALDTQKDFDEFTDRIWKKEIVNSTLDLHFTLADPESYGITDYPITFGTCTLDQMLEDVKSVKSMKMELESIDETLLTEPQQLTFRILESYLDTQLKSDGLELYYQPLAPTIGLQAQLPVLLSEYEFHSKKDVEDYLKLLSLIDDLYNEVLSFEQEKANAGLFMSDESVDHVITSCESFLLPPDSNFMAETFASRLDGLAEKTPLSDTERADYISRDNQLLAEDFTHAYNLLIDGLNSLKGTGVNDGGMSGYPEGKKYYDYLVASKTGTSYSSIKDLKKAIEKQMNQDLSDISSLVQTNPELKNQIHDYSFQFTEPADILEHLKTQLAGDYPALPESTYEIKYVPKALEPALSPAFYVMPPLDAYTDNTIYINRGGHLEDESHSLFPTLAHEGYPGHLFQNVYFCAHNDSDLRQLLTFPSYNEGWATYVEYQSYTMDSGLPDDLGTMLSLNSSATLALYALLDININYYDWTKDQVSSYLNQYYEVDGTDLVDDLYSTFIENPANYLTYYTGYLEIHNMRLKAESSLKKDFNAKDFHTFLLDIGPAPFSVISPYFSSWLLLQ